jgi:hypothetical protein
MERARAADPEITVLREMMRAWGDAMGIGYDARCKLRELIEKSGDHPELAAAIQMVLGTRKEPDARRLGKWLQYKKDRIVGGMRLTCHIDSTRGATWWIENINAEPTSEEDPPEVEGVQF